MRAFRLTRLAPTPSGYLHAGNILSFILTAGLARRSGAGILLRIDDLDRDRFREEYLDEIFSTLRFLEIPWTSGPLDSIDFHRHFSQHLRLHLYEDALMRLLSRNKLFACRCTRKQNSGPDASTGYPGTCLHLNLPPDIMDHSWRLKPVAQIHFPLTDAFGQTTNHSLPDDMQMSVVRRKDGLPAYHLASLTDDEFFEVDLVVRGADLLPSTIFQQALADCLGGVCGFKSAGFIHHPVLTAPDGHKLSKSAGSGSIVQMRKEGYSRSEIMQRLAGMAGIEQTVDSWEDLFSELSDRWLTNQG